MDSSIVWSELDLLVLSINNIGVMLVHTYQSFPRHPQGGIGVYWQGVKPSEYARSGCKTYLAFLAGVAPLSLDAVVHFFPLSSAIFDVGCRLSEREMSVFRYI